MVAGNMAELTGDPLLAMHSIGDTDLRMANKYLGSGATTGWRRLRPGRGQPPPGAKK
jgi:hypothetical protein